VPERTGGSARIRQDGRPGDTKSHQASTGFLDQPRAWLRSARTRALRSGAAEQSVSLQEPLRRSLGIAARWPRCFHSFVSAGPAHRGSTQPAGIAATASRRPHCEFKEAQHASKTRASTAGAGAIAMNCDPAVRLADGGKGYNSSRVRFTGQRSQTASHTPRRASSAPAGAAAAPGFSGSPEKPRPLKYMQDGCGP
jgi:hypothetical protein